MLQIWQKIENMTGSEITQLWSFTTFGAFCRCQKISQVGMNSYRTTHISNFMAIAWNLCDLQCFKNRKIWQIYAIFRFFAFLGNFEFLPWLQIFEMTLETLSIDWLHLYHNIFSFIWSQIFQKLQTRIWRFRDFRNNFAKIT